jgi:uncharacterized protein YvpB
MSEIQVSTSELRSGSQNLSSAANEIGGVKNQIGGIPASVGNAYDGQLRQVLQGILGGGVQIGAHLQSRSIELGDELLSRAMGFEAANEAVKGSVLGASTAYVNFVSTTKKFSFLSFLGVSRSKALSIWGISGLAGFMSLFFVKTQPEILTPFPEAGTFDQHSEATQSSKPNSQKTGFGILMEEYEQKRQASENENSNKPVPIEESESPTTQYDTYYDVPIKSQGTAYGSAACLPTSISMVMDYYKTQNANNNTASPDDLIKMLDKGDGTYGNGIGLDKMNDDLSEMGYESTIKSGNMDDLAEKLKEGPVIVNAGVKLVSNPARDITQAGSTNHSILVKAINNDSVVVNDPWSGSEKSFSRELFEKMWSNGQNYMVIVRPPKQ